MFKKFLDELFSPNVFRNKIAQTLSFFPAEGLDLEYWVCPPRGILL